MFTGTILGWTTEIYQTECNTFHDIYLMGNKKQLKQTHENFANTVEEAEFTELYKYAPLNLMVLNI